MATPTMDAGSSTEKGADAADGYVPPGISQELVKEAMEVGS